MDLQSAFLKLNRSDFVKGLVVFVGAAVFTELGSLLSAPGFTNLDWHEVLRIAVVSAFSYLGKNLVSDNQGKIFGKIG